MYITTINEKDEFHLWLITQEEGHNLQNSTHRRATILGHDYTLLIPGAWCLNKPGFDAERMCAECETCRWCSYSYKNSAKVLNLSGVCRHGWTQVLSSINPHNDDRSWSPNKKKTNPKCGNANGGPFFGISLSSITVMVKGHYHQSRRGGNKLFAGGGSFANYAQSL